MVQNAFIARAATAANLARSIAARAERVDQTETFECLNCEFVWSGKKSLCKRCRSKNVVRLVSVLQE